MHSGVFETLSTEGVILTPANSITKEGRTMKFCTVIVYYIVSITQQLNFLNSHFSIV